MTDPRPGGPPRPFTPAELEGAPGIAPDELAGGTRIARELEAIAARTPVIAPPGFPDRVMDTIAAEPIPAPVRAAGRALRQHALGAFLGSLRDAWRVSVSPGFPIAARAQAMALVLVLAGLAAGSGMATVGALGLLDGNRPGPSPSVEGPSTPVTPATPKPTVSPAPRTDASPPEPSPSPEPTETPDATATPDGTHEPDGTDDHGGGSGDDHATATPESDDDHEEDHDRTPSPTSTPDDDGHGATPEPTETPHSDDR